jgi:hypothetical protein
VKLIKINIAAAGGGGHNRFTKCICAPRVSEPTPWSGLWFHPIEPTLYFSCLLVSLALPLPYYVFVLHKFGLVLAQAMATSAYAECEGQSSFFGSHSHYIYHIKFSYKRWQPTGKFVPAPHPGEPLNFELLRSIFFAS